MLRLILILIKIAPPLPPALTVSLTSLDPASCSGSVSIAWTPGDSDRSVDTYFLFLNGDLINTLSSSINTYSHSFSIILDTNYTYSITANSCAGNSTQPNQAKDTIYVESKLLLLLLLLLLLINIIVFPSRNFIN